MRLIDADATLDAIEAAWEKQRRGKTLHDQSVCAGIAEAERIVQRAPTIDAAPVVHARWEVNTDDFTPRKRCSNCGYNRPIKAGENIKQEPETYCNACGARMDAPERAGKDGQS